MQIQTEPAGASRREQILDAARKMSKVNFFKSVWFHHKCKKKNLMQT